MENLAKRFYRRQPVVCLDKQGLVEIHHRQHKRIQRMALDALVVRDFANELRDMPLRKLRNLRNLIAVIVQQLDIHQLPEIRNRIRAHVVLVACRSQYIVPFFPRPDRVGADAREVFQVADASEA